MSERERRIGLNEAVFREVNEHVESLSQGTDALSIVCECGELSCTERLFVSPAKYEAVRAHAALFLVAPGHVAADVEDVVERSDGFEIVRKHEGEAQQIAEETDPRR
ncbi:MAG: hypothetical protein HOQ28_08825 [Thermoleophilia bacterium]|nr:hypothetical protein [Thermoleophilia bacterium]